MDGVQYRTVPHEESRQLMACETARSPKTNSDGRKERKRISTMMELHPSDFSLEEMDGRMPSTVELLSFRTIKSASRYTFSRRSYHRGTHPFANRNAAPKLRVSLPLRHLFNISGFRGHAAASKRDCWASWSSLLSCSNSRLCCVS
ncbi:hypothetical protein B296_00018871 [Ensete ventricosum]|uniref:Uncharacterized protein n=1 Tax=Ensete ventricosum TaxID=4639 RepID=A0A427B077_ENSVE|nr:hypothetical protein B296_00018871 [Ensete ventricosum]